MRRRDQHARAMHHDTARRHESSDGSERSATTPAIAAEEAGVAGGIEGPGAASRRAEGGHVPALDGVRGYAVLAVIVFHSIYNFQPANAVEALVDPVFEAGWAGVDLFFVLSGFLITGILVRSKGRPRYYRNFMIRRALRIMPLYFAYVALTLWVFPAIGLVSAADAALMRERQAWVWTFLTNFGLVKFAANGVVHLSHLWSVAVEEQFYLVWPLVVAMLSTRSLRRLCIAIVIAAPALRLAASFAGMSAHAINWTTPLRLDALALGGLAAIMVREDGIEATLRRARVLGIGAALVLLAIFVRQHGLTNHFRAVYVVGYSALAMVGVWFVVAAARQVPSRAVRALASNAFMRLLGRYSYSLYMFHMLVMVALERVGIRLERFPTILGSNLPGAVAFCAIVTAASLAVAGVTWYVLEQPALALKERFAPSR